MKNDAGRAKLDVSGNSCQLSDVEYLEDVTSMYQIDEDGEPVQEIDHTMGDLVCYVCRGCEVEFEDFKQVKEHFND